MDIKSWLKIVEMAVPLILGSTKLAPLVPYVTMGVQVAEQIPGAKGEDKLKVAGEIANIGLKAVNAQAVAETGKPLVNEDSAKILIDATINGAVAAANIKAKDVPVS